MPKSAPLKKRTKNQHYVPQLHLKRFRSESPKNMVWTYDKGRGTVRALRTEETGSQNNFYSVKEADGTYNDVLDLWLQGVESAAAAPYDDLLRGNIPVGQARADFSVFVSSLYARSPSLIRANARGYAQFLQHLVDLQFSTREGFEAAMDRYESESGQTVNRDQMFETWNDKSRFVVEVSQKRGLPAMRVADDLTKLFLDREWYLIEPLDGYFITSDSPVFKFTDSEHWHAFYGDGGFMNPKAEVTVPLSPQLMLLITGDRLDYRSFGIPAEVVWNLNGGRAYAADRLLFAHLKDERVSALAAEHREPPELFEIQGAGPFHEIKVTR